MWKPCPLLGAGVGGSCQAPWIFAVPLLGWFMGQTEGEQGSKGFRGGTGWFWNARKGQECWACWWSGEGEPAAPE